jgi:hypothetical protein
MSRIEDMIKVALKLEREFPSRSRC